jgi:hypothetical protein
MRSLVVSLGSFIAAVAAASGAVAQTDYYTAQPPGQPPVYVDPTPGGGGYIVNTPGRPPTYVNPGPGDSYVVERPGETPTYLRPQQGGGYLVETPGRPPTTLNLVPNATPGVAKSCATTQACK